MSDNYQTLKRDSKQIICRWFFWFIGLFVKLFKEIFSKNTRSLLPRYAALCVFLLALMHISGFLGVFSIFGVLAGFAYSGSMDAGAYFHGMFFFSAMCASYGVFQNIPFLPITFILLFVLNKFQAFWLTHIIIVCLWGTIVAIVLSDSDEFFAAFIIAAFWLSIFSMTAFRLAGESMGFFEKQKKIAKKS
ncbi:MAG: hypothetical protein HRT94_00365 [Alphaproteobacteria bacterium]|nr:hypothetical protein [Alphaproteobacteria bacterium]